MALFDQFSPLLGANGQGPANQQATQGAPGFNFGSWGNALPPGLAAGLQQYLGRGISGAQGPQPGGTMPLRGAPSPVTQPVNAAGMTPGGATMPGAPQMPTQSGAVQPPGPAGLAGGMSPYLRTN